MKPPENKSPAPPASEMISLIGFRPFFVAAVAFLTLTQLAFVLLAIPQSLTGRSDFRQLYSAGYMLRTGQGSHLYDYRATVAYEEQLAGTTGARLPYNHPAYEALIFAPLSLLSYRQAFLLFFLFNVVILTVSFRLLLPPAEWITSLWPHLPIGLFAGFLPVGVCLIQGQDSIIMLALVAGSYVLAQRGRDGIAGSLLALSLFKFQFIVPVVLLFAARRRWKLLGGFFVAMLVLVVISLFIAGLDSLQAYPKYLASMSAGLRSEAQRQTYGIYPEKMSNIRGLFYLIFGSWLPLSTLQILTVSSSVLILLWAARTNLPLETAVVVGFLVSYHAPIHDAVILLLALMKLPRRVSPHLLGPLGAWSLLAASPTLVFVLNLPFSLVGVSALLFLAICSLATGTESSLPPDMQATPESSPTCRSVSP